MKKILLLLILLGSFRAYSQRIYFTSEMRYKEWDYDKHVYEITEHDTTDSYFYIDTGMHFIHTPDENFHITLFKKEYYECLDDDSAKCLIIVQRKYRFVLLNVVYFDHYREYIVDAESSNMY
jgi:hypothetical protein